MKPVKPIRFKKPIGSGDGIPLKWPHPPLPDPGVKEPDTGGL